MSYLVKFYQSGQHVFFNKLEKVEILTKSELLEISDLRHYSSTNREFFNTVSTCCNGRPKRNFSLFSKGCHYLVCYNLNVQTYYSLTGTKNGEKVNFGLFGHKKTAEQYADIWKMYNTEIIEHKDTINPNFDSRD